MALLYFLGRRATLRIGWELRDGPFGFRELQRRCEISSPTLLSQRLREGLELGTLERDREGRYALTTRGRDLIDVLAPLDAWAVRWARRLRR